MPKKISKPKKKVSSKLKLPLKKKKTLNSKKPAKKKVIPKISLQPISKETFLIQKTIKVYDENAGQFAEYAEHRLPQFELNKFITFLNGKKILDIGCGSGRDMRYFKEEGYLPTGIDASFGMLSEAKSRGNANYCLMDMRILGLKEASFDGIWGFCSLLHVPKQDVLQTLLEFKRILKKNGVVFLAVKEGEGEQIKDSKSLPGKRRFYSFFSQIEIETFVLDAGFELISATPESYENQNYIYLFFRKN